MNLNYNVLYDYYGDSLTEKEQLYFEDFYFNDLSYKEIAENYNVSRSAIYNLLKESLKKLDYYEDKLRLFEKGKKINKLIKPLDDDLKNKIKELI